MARKRKRWVRDGTIWSSGVTEINLRTVRTIKRRGAKQYDWITVKGATDARTERLAEILLLFLNG